MANSKHPPLTFIVNDDASMQRIDNFLFRKLKKVPKSLIYKMLRKGWIRINKRRVKPDYHLKADDVLRLPYLVEGKAETIAKPSKKFIQRLEQNILYEDENLIILNKPSGIAVHGGSNISFGVIETMRVARPKLKNLELAHRLDRDTSGCLILAKKRSILREIHEELRQGRVKKDYLALIGGKWLGGKIAVTAGLKKNRLKSGEHVVKVNGKGRTALTIFQPRQIFKAATLVAVKLSTGRTHQIRVHAAHIGHPIAGDEKYGVKEFNAKLRNIGLKRLFLHAAHLTFKLPSIAKVIKVTAPLPEDLQAVLTLIMGNYLATR